MSALEQIVVTGCPTCGAPAQAIAEGEGVRYRHVGTATLKAAQGGVTEAMVGRAVDAFDKMYEAELEVSSARYTDNKAASMRAALEAALSAEQGQGEGDGWSKKVVGDTVHISYTPPAQPAERVPEGWVLVPREALGYVSDLLAERKYGNAARSPAHNARVVVDYWLASPAPSPARGDGGEG